MGGGGVNPSVSNPLYSYSSHQTLSSHSIVFYSEGAQYYNTFKPILDALDALNHPYAYYSSDENDPGLKRHISLKDSQNRVSLDLLNDLDSQNRVSQSSYDDLDSLHHQHSSSQSLYSSSSQTHSDSLPSSTDSYHLNFYPSSSLHRPHTQSRFAYIGKGNKAYSFLNTLRADILVLTTPGLDVLHIKRQAGVKHYCHIVHSLSPMTYRVFGVDYFHSVLVANAVQRDFVRQIESAHCLKPKHIAITGSTYLDELYKIHSQFQTNPSITSSSPRILISPSWGKESLLSKYGLELLLPLAQSGFTLLIRPHPQSSISPSESKNLSYLKQALKEYQNVSWDTNTSNVYAFMHSDLMISDFSSVIFDYVCLQSKPVITIEDEMDLSGYDMADIPRDQIWTFQALKSIGRRLHPDEFKDIKDIILQIFQSYRTGLDSQTQSELNFNSQNDLDSLTHTLSSLQKLLWQYPHNAGLQSALELLKIERELIERALKPQARLVARYRELEGMINTAKIKDIPSEDAHNSHPNGASSSLENLSSPQSSQDSTFSKQSPTSALSQNQSHCTHSSLHQSTHCISNH